MLVSALEGFFGIFFKLTIQLVKNNGSSLIISNEMFLRDVSERVVRNVKLLSHSCRLVMTWCSI